MQSEQLTHFWRKSGKATIGKQFEYNTYIRDFFADNKEKTLEDAIKCWNYKKRLQGSNRYERSDLTALAAYGHPKVEEDNRYANIGEDVNFPDTKPHHEKDKAEPKEL